MKRRLFVALVTFERGSDDSGMLPPDTEGASGHIGIKAPHIDDVPRIARQALSGMGFQMIEVEDVEELTCADEAKRFNETLAKNAEESDDSEEIIWGTLHTYIGLGEA